MLPFIVMFMALPLLTKEYQTSLAGEAIGITPEGWQLMRVVYGCSLIEFTFVRPLKVDTAPRPDGHAAGKPNVPNACAPKQSSFATCALAVDDSIRQEIISRESV
jgi:hypothetical protein